MIKKLEAALVPLEEIADESMMDAVVELLPAPEFAGRLFLICRALHAISRFEAKLDQAENSALQDDRKH
jgi:hypothetical protein